MVLPHRITQERSWGVICHSCANQRIAAPFYYRTQPRLQWLILDKRAAHLARTGPLGPAVKRTTWVHRERRTPDGEPGDFTDSRGLMLVLVAHHHRRGHRLSLADDLWEAAETLTGLGGPWAGAQLLLEAVKPAD